MEYNEPYWRQLTHRRTVEGQRQRRLLKQKTGKDTINMSEVEWIPKQEDLANTLTGGQTKDQLLVLVTPKSTSTQLKSTKGTSMEIIDPTYGTGLRTYQRIAPTLRADRFGLCVLDTRRSTSTQSKHINNTLEDTKTMETQLKSTQQNSQTLTSWWEDFHARLSPLLENEKDLTTPEGHSFLTSLGFSQKKDPDIWYSKMLKVYLVTTAEKLSRQSLGFLPTWGISWNGRYLTAKTSEFPKTGSVCSLSDILEENPDEKYFLSSEQTAKILSSELSERAVSVQQLKNTLDASQTSGVKQQTRIRRLTPLECERLQGFPDNWTVGSDTQRYKQCGNAVTVNVVEALCMVLA